MYTSRLPFDVEPVLTRSADVIHGAHLLDPERSVKNCMQHPERSHTTMSFTALLNWKKDLYDYNRGNSLMLGPEARKDPLESKTV